MRQIAIMMLLIGAQACTWVKLTDAGAAVRQASADDVGTCTRVGTTSASTANRAVFKRSRGQVAEELITLARNQAAGLGGNAIVPDAPQDQGHQSFTVYRCP